MKTQKWFVWNGKNSYADFGLWVRKFPKHTRAKERYEEIEIPGRPGSLTLTEGEDVYAAYSDEMVVSCKDGINIDKVIEWLRGSGDLVLSDDISKARTGRIVNEVKFDREEKEHLFVGTIPFLFQPFRKLIKPYTISVTAASDTISNPGDVASKPVVSITGSGNNTITIDGQAMTFALGSSSVTINVDCDAHIITSGNAIWSGTFSGEFWKIPKGQSTITQTGSDTIVIAPNWRWL